MPWDGAGNFSRDNGTNSGATTWVQDRDASTKITAPNHDTHDQDLANGINSSLQKNGENAATADLPMGTNKHTGVGDATAKTHYASAGQIVDGLLVYAAAAGTDTYTATLAISPVAYAAGQRYAFLVTNANTTAATINIQGLGAKAITKFGATALAPGDMKANSIVELIYDGTQFQLMNVYSSSTAGDFLADGTVPMTAALDMAGYAIKDPAMEKASDATVSTTTTHTFTYSDGGIHKVTFSGSVTVTLAASGFPTSLGSGIIVDAVNWGAITAVTIPAAWKFAGGVAPTWTVSGLDRFLLYRDGDDAYTIHMIDQAIATV